MSTTTVPVPTAPPTFGQQRVPKPLTAKQARRLKAARKPASPQSLARLADKFGPNHGVRHADPVVSPSNNGFDGERKPGNVSSESALRSMKRDWAKWGQTPNPQGPPAHMTHRGVAVAGSSGDSNSGSGGN